MSTNQTIDDSNLSNIDAALAAGEQIAGVEPRIYFAEDPDRRGQPGATVPVALVTERDEDGVLASRVEVLSDLAEAWHAAGPGPHHRQTEATLTEEASFTAHVQRWSSDRTVIYADTSALGFTAVYDEHPAGETGAGWRRHRAHYKCPRSPQWIAWTAQDGKPMSQVAFGDFLESRLEDLAIGKDDKGARIAGSPAPLDMLQIARQLTIKTKGTFRRDIDPTTGSFVFEHKNEQETGSTVIPRAFYLAIPVFDGGDRYQVEARVRFVLEEAGPRFSYTLHRRPELERDAFREVRERISKDTGRLVLAGAP